MKYTKKLIEVALPLDAINEASVREKSIRHGHPSSLHLWWARRPLAAARAVIFAQMVDDPSEYIDVLLSDSKKKRAAERDLQKRIARRAEQETDGDNEASKEPAPTLAEVIAEHERDRLFKIIRALVEWENTTNETVLQWARDEIWQSWRRACANNADHPRTAELFNRHQLPAFHDPFAGGGALPLEAQRLGLKAFASDLNPVAVLINKAMIEIPLKFTGRPAVNPVSRLKSSSLKIGSLGAQGLAEDIYYYGKWILNETIQRIGHLYPKVKITDEMAESRQDLKRYAGRNLTVITWIWVRTVKSPNPAFLHIQVPLASTFILSKRKGKETYVEPIVEGSNYSFKVKRGKPSDLSSVSQGTKLAGSHSSFRCLLSGTPIPFEYIRSEAKAGQMRTRLMALVAEGDQERVYCDPSEEHESYADSTISTHKPELEISHWPGRTNVVEYGMTRFGDLFNVRQLAALTTFSDLIAIASDRIKQDAIDAGMCDDNLPLRDGGTGALAYAESVSVYLSFVVSKQADLGNTLCTWEPIAQCPRHLFGRQAIPMVWDYAEGNPLGNSSGSWITFLKGIHKAFLNTFGVELMRLPGYSAQQDAAKQNLSFDKIISTDPPYYDNIGYAGLSDFFYAWLRRSLKNYFPESFSTISTPKSEELVANAYRHRSANDAEEFFLHGMKNVESRRGALVEGGGSSCCRRLSP